ncbi:hypothetical protein KKD61_01370 [Patescibacteria group bacterium]|nr:hypothetical protein [Patescibacteria group bacterium]
MDRALKRVKGESSFPSGLPEDVVTKAKEIEKVYGDRKYGLPGTPRPWEIVGQTTAKLRVVAGKPELHDPDGSKKKKYEAIIRAFDVKGEAFPSSFDPETGTFLQKGN